MTVFTKLMPSPLPKELSMNRERVVIHSSGGYDKLQFETSPIPHVGDSEVLIETVACGVNLADCFVRMGLYDSAKKYVGWPITPGFEVSGIIKEVGSKVKLLAVGQRVVAITRFGGYTTHLAVDENQVFVINDKLDLCQAAGIPAVFLTAYYAMFELAHPRKGTSVLIHSAAGGVGSSLVQLAHIAGCKAVAVVGSSHKIDFLKQYSPTHIIDKSCENLWEKASEYAPDGYSAVFDANGFETLRQSYDHLAPGGKLIVYGFHSMLSKGRGTPNWIKLAWDYLRTPKFNPLQMTTDNKSVMAFNLSYLFDRIDLFREALQVILDWIDQGIIQPPCVKSIPFKDVAQAHQELESGMSVGKLVLKV